jgi:hypothetical protein
MMAFLDVTTTKFAFVHQGLALASGRNALLNGALREANQKEKIQKKKLML